MTDTITIVRARHRRLAKLIQPDGQVEGYDLARTVDLIAHPVADLAHLQRLLLRLQRRPDCAVVRGDVINRAAANRVRRLVHVDRKTGEAATLQETRRCWVALDVDGLEMPLNVDLRDLEACGRAALARLPHPFQDTASIVQASASHGIKPGLRLRLWAWLDRPTGGAELTRWLRAAPVDLSVFRPAQLIYTAAPIFAGGRPDHLAARLAMLDGNPAVAVPSVGALAPPPRRGLPPLPSRGDTRAARYAFAALTNAAARVAQAGEGNRHRTIVSQAMSLARFVAAGLLSESDVRRGLEGAADAAGKPHGEAGAIVDWAMQQPVTRDLPEGIRA